MFGWKVYQEKTVGAQTFTICEPFFAQSHSKAAQILSILFFPILWVCVCIHLCSCGVPACVYIVHTHVCTHAEASG